MDYYNQYNIKSMNDQKKSNHMNKITRILVSVSVFGFLVSQSSLVPLLFQSYENLVLDFSNYKIRLFTYTTERNCIFLLCNGILLLIIQSSGLITKITPVISASKAARFEDHHEEGDDGNLKSQDKEKKGVVKDEILEEQTGENVAAEILEIEEEEEEEEEDDDDDEQSSCEVEEEAAGMDVDELNKKCEDFIKKMKKLIQN